jgi:hypothetical protein
MAKQPFLLGIYGPPAVGKMAVGMEVSRVTGAPLLHVHLLIDLVTPFFNFGTEPFARLTNAFRERIITETMGAGTNLILTAVPPFNDPTVMQMIEATATQAEDAGGEALFVELHAPLEVRLQRNQTALRRASKNTDWATDEVLISQDRSHVTVAEAGVTLPGRHLVIDNTELPADAAANRIVEEFGLPRVGGT